MLQGMPVLVFLQESRFLRKLFVSTPWSYALNAILKYSIRVTERRSLSLYILAAIVLKTKPIQERRDYCYGSLINGFLYIILYYTISK